jgi:hypothetical protein
MLSNLNHDIRTSRLLRVLRPLLPAIILQNLRLRSIYRIW